MEFFNMFGGLALAFLGAGLAVGLCCVGSARGTGMVGEAATGVLSVTPERLSSCLVLQVLPGTQGLYGLVVWFFALFQMGAFSGGIQNVTLTGGFSVFIACLPIMLGGYLSVWFGMRTSFFVGSGCLFLVTMMVIFFVRDIPISKETRRQDMHVVRDLRLALQNRGLLYVMFMFFLVQTCIMTIQPLITLYVEKLMGGAGDASVTMSGWIFSLAGIAGIIASPYWGKRGQRKGFVRTLCLVLFCAGSVNLCQVFVGNIWEFAVIQFIYGLFLSGAVPNINSTLVEVTPPEMRGKAFGLTTSAQQFGGVVGPLLGGFLGDHMPTKFVLFTTGVILLSAALYTVRTRLRKTM